VPSPKELKHISPPELNEPICLWWPAFHRFHNQFQSVNPHYSNQFAIGNRCRRTRAPQLAMNADHAHRRPRGARWLTSLFAEQFLLSGGDFQRRERSTRRNQEYGKKREGMVTASATPTLTPPA